MKINVFNRNFGDAQMVVLTSKNAQMVVLTSKGLSLFNIQGIFALLTLLESKSTRQDSNGQAV
jgi:hypothetical protein